MLFTVFGITTDVIFLPPKALSAILVTAKVLSEKVTVSGIVNSVTS